MKGDHHLWVGRRRPVHRDEGRKWSRGTTRVCPVTKGRVASGRKEQSEATSALERVL